MQGLSPVPPSPKQQVYIDDDRAAYKVVEKRGFFDENDTLWPQGAMIYWDGPLNMGLEPINQIAIDSMREYLTHLDAEGVKVAKERGTGHATLVNAFEARNRLQSLNKIENKLVGIEPEIQVLGKQKSNVRMAESIGKESTIVPVMSATEPRRGRPRKEA